MSANSESAQQEPSEVNKNPQKLKKVETFGYFGPFGDYFGLNKIEQPRKTDNLNLDPDYLKSIALRHDTSTRPLSVEQTPFPVNSGSAGARNNDSQASLMEMFNAYVENGCVKTVTKTDDGDSDWGLEGEVNSTTYAHHTSPVNSMGLEEGLEEVLDMTSPHCRSDRKRPQHGPSPPSAPKKTRTRPTTAAVTRGLFN